LKTKLKQALEFQEILQMATATIKSFSIKNNDLDLELDHNLAVLSIPSFI